MMQKEGTQEQIEQDIRKVEQETIKVEEQIEKVERKIEKIEATLYGGELPRHFTAELLHEEKRQLREKESQLREKERQLREEKRQLREKEARLQGAHREDVDGLLQSELQGLKLEVHGVREALPSVLVGHVITPSKASRNPQAVSTVFDALGMSQFPVDDGSTFSLPSDQCAEEKWLFSWKWPVASSNHKPQERDSYKPVLNFLRGLSFHCQDVSEGQHCVGKLLFNSDIYSRRQQNPTISGQTVFLRHRVEGRCDIVVLNRDHHGGDILRNMVRFALEIKTIDGYRRSSSGCMREAQLQLIGLNAFNTNCSPPVLLTNLANIHKVLYLDVDDNWQYCIRVRTCDSFPAAVYFANQRGSRLAISQHFSRPTTPDTESDFRISV